jgi:hypothetical protein
VTRTSLVIRGWIVHVPNSYCRIPFTVPTVVPTAVLARAADWQSTPG